MHSRRRTLILVVVGALTLVGDGASGAELLVGAATADITPEPPVVLAGMRIATTVESRCMASVLALESRDGDRVVDQAIVVSCDLCILPGIQQGFRQHVADRLPGFDVGKLFLAATHTHTSMMVYKNEYDEKDYGDAVQPKDYLPLLYERLAEAVVKAWESRSVGAVAWGLGHAVVGCNRRAVYEDGHAQMYGNPNDPEFRHIEGYEDHAVDVLCFYDHKKRLKATAITLACPAQSAPRGQVSADFWHDVRELLRKRHGEDLCVLGFCAPAGDQTPNLTFGKAGEARMQQLRGLTRTQELGRRIADAVDDVAGVIAGDVRADVPLVHLVRQVDLPARIVTEAECADAQKVCDAMDAEKAKGEAGARRWYWRVYYGMVVDRYHAQQKGDRRVYPVEVHVLRLGDVAVATNPFELYLDYGVQIQARSAAGQTILIQLASAPSSYAGYVPTPRAVEAAGYSAEVVVNMVGPEGAQVLVDRTVEAINEVWEK
ncbi:MAG TPA: hypothetical protein VMY37_03550 [Thermoguttaceae bacterium]|nr:hypothetical protein [Thermoguttaceae bacterium]